MKKILFLKSVLITTLVSMLSLVFASCGDDDDVPPPTPELSVSKSELKFDINGGEKTFKIESNVGWKITTNKDWISVDISKDEGDKTITVEVEKNDEFGDDRTGKITITSTEGNLKEEVTVIQKSTTIILDVDKSSLSFVAEGGNQTFQISSNIKWKITSSDSWLSVNNSSGSGDASITAIAEANNTNGGRSAKLTISGAEGNVTPVTITVTQEVGNITVSPTSASLLSEKGSTTNLTVTSSGKWELSGMPEWLHSTAYSGVGQTTLTLTALSDNFSDEERKVTLSFSSGAKSVSVNISQAPYLAQGCKVEMSNMTLMSNGFACDLKFGSRAKGYREAFFSQSDIASKTERDIYNLLMEKTEYEKTADFTFSPIVDPNTTFIYCVAAYGNENNTDGSHKYGPMTMKTITTPSTTYWADMPIYGISYTSTKWSPITQKYGAVGTRCQKYYFFGAQGDFADELFIYYMLAPDAVLAHFYYKGWIAEDPNDYAIAAQTFSYQRSSDKFFFGTWGVDDTNTFSNELNSAYTDLSESEAKPLKKQVAAKSSWNDKRKIPTRAEVQASMKHIKAYRIQ